MDRRNWEQNDILYRRKYGIDHRSITNYHGDIYRAGYSLSISKALVEMFLVGKFSTHMGGEVWHWVSFNDEKLPKNVKKSKWPEKKSKPKLNWAQIYKVVQKQKKLFRPTDNSFLVKNFNLHSSRMYPRSNTVSLLFSTHSLCRFMKKLFCFREVVVRI